MRFGPGISRRICAAPPGSYFSEHGHGPSRAATGDGHGPYRQRCSWHSGRDASATPGSATGGCDRAALIGSRLDQRLLHVAK